MSQNVEMRAAYANDFTSEDGVYIKFWHLPFVLTFALSHLIPVHIIRSLQHVWFSECSPISYQRRVHTTCQLCAMYVKKICVYYLTHHGEKGFCDNFDIKYKMCTNNCSTSWRGCKYCTRQDIRSMAKIVNACSKSRLFFKGNYIDNFSFCLIHLFFFMKNINNENKYFFSWLQCQI